MKRPRIVLSIAVGLSASAAFLLFSGAHDHVSEREFSMRTVCKMNLRQIREAKARWASEDGKNTNEVATWSDLLGGKFFAEEPYCPKGGTYTIGRIGDLPRCSIPSHAIY